MWVYVGSGWEQKEADRKLMETMGTWWEQKEFHGNKRILMGTVWELDKNNGNLMGIQPATLQKDNEYQLRHVGSTQLALLTCFILRFFLGTSYLDRYPCMEMFLTNCLGQGEKIRWTKKKGGQTMCACAHSICLPPFLPADFREQAGRTQGLHNHVRAPKICKLSEETF